MQPLTGLINIVLHIFIIQGPEIKHSFLDGALAEGGGTAQKVTLHKEGEGRGVSARAGGMVARLITEEMSGMGGWQLYGVDAVLA